MYIHVKIFRIESVGWRVQGLGLRAHEAQPGGEASTAAEMRRGSEAGSYLRSIDVCITQLWA